MEKSNQDFLLKESPFRRYLVGLDTRVPLPSGKMVPYINFDNAATTPPLQAVMEAINDFAPWYSSIHRGKGYKSQYSTRLYEESRKIVAAFFQADLSKQTVIYVKNTTEAINKIASRLAAIYPDGVVLSSEMEHHSNDLPWRNKLYTDYIALNSRGKISLTDLEAKLIFYQGKVKLVAITGASNVTGIVNPVHEIARLAHHYGADILVDGAQLAPHQPIALKPGNNPEHLDHLVFSAHKLYAPFGTGVLISPVEFFQNNGPDYSGGGTVQVVTRDTVVWAEPPWKDEAGTPNLLGVVALMAALGTLKTLDMNEITLYEKSLTAYTYREMQKIPGVELYIAQGDHQNKEREIQASIGIIPFNISGLSHETVSTILAREAGIAVRNGCFCAQPYIQKLLHISGNRIKNHLLHPELPHPGLVRLSFGMYNNKTEVDAFLEMLEKIVHNREKYRQKYVV